jgi:predicted RND superfamily exporter protein
VAGFGASTLSTLPPVHLYGLVVVIVLVATMLGGLLFLPALIAMLERWRYPVKTGPSQS